jgi:hypothetical protein
MLTPVAREENTEGRTRRQRNATSNLSVVLHSTAIIVAVCEQVPIRLTGTRTARLNPIPIRVTVEQRGLRIVH